MTATPFPAHQPVPERRSDPSMEEILASIRRIIADDDPPSLRPSVPPVMPAVRDPEEGRPASVTSISSTTRAPGVSSFGFTRAQPAPVIAPEPVVPVTPEMPLEEPARAADPVASDLELRAASHDGDDHADDDGPAPRHASSEPSRAASSAGSDATRPAPAGDTGALVSATTTNSIASAFQALSASVALTNAEVIDRHVRDLLRPMLRSWLDDNLPTIVEKLVRTEIERVARGGR